MSRKLLRIFSVALVFSFALTLWGCEPWEEGASGWDTGQVSSVHPVTSDVGPGSGEPYVFGGGTDQASFPQYLYLADHTDPVNSSGAIIVFKLSQNGTIELAGDPVTVGVDYPFDAFTSADGKFLYVASGYTSSINSYSTSPALSHLDSKAITAHSYVSMVLTEQGGKAFSYITGYDDDNGSLPTLVGLASDASGVLKDQVVFEHLSTQSPPPFIPAPGLAVGPGGSYLYFLDSNTSGTGTITSRQILAGGSLGSTSPSVPTLGNPYQLVFSPDGKFAYATDLYNSNYYQYTVDSASGQLANAALNPFAGGGQAVKTLVHPKRPFLFVLSRGNGASGTIISYTIALDGSLSLTPSTEQIAFDYPSTMVMDLSGQYLIAVLSNSDDPNNSALVVFKINEDGSLHQVGTYDSIPPFFVLDGSNIGVGK